MFRIFRGDNLAGNWLEIMPVNSRWKNSIKNARLRRLIRWRIINYWAGGIYREVQVSKFYCPCLSYFERKCLESACQHTSTAIHTHAAGFAGRQRLIRLLDRDVLTRARGWSFARKIDHGRRIASVATHTRFCRLWRDGHGHRRDRP
jgi:hypothetical protein